MTGAVNAQLAAADDMTASWAVDFATESAQGASADPLIQKLFRIFLVFTDELDAVDLQCQSYKQCIERRHKLSVDEVRAICALLSREVATFGDLPSTSDNASWARAACACCDMTQRIANYPEQYTFKEFIWILGKIFPERAVIEAAVEGVFQRICNQIIKHGFVYVFRKSTCVLRSTHELVWLTATPGKLSFYTVDSKGSSKAVKTKEYILTNKSNTFAQQVDDGHIWTTVELEPGRTLVFASLNNIDRVRWLAAVNCAISRANTTENVYRPLLRRLRKWQQGLVRRLGNRYIVNTAVIRSPTDISLDIDGQRISPKAKHSNADQQSEIELLKQQLQQVQQSARDEEIVRALATRMLEEERAKREATEATANEQAEKLMKEKELRLKREQELASLREQLQKMHEDSRRTTADMLQQLKAEQEDLCVHQKEMAESVSSMHSAFNEQLQAVVKNLSSDLEIRHKQQQVIAELKVKQQSIKDNQTKPIYQESNDTKLVVMQDTVQDDLQIKKPKGEAPNFVCDLTISSLNAIEHEESSNILRESVSPENQKKEPPPLPVKPTLQRSTMDNEQFEVADDSNLININENANLFKKASPEDEDIIVVANEEIPIRETYYETSPLKEIVSMKQSSVDTPALSKSEIINVEAKSSTSSDANIALIAGDDEVSLIEQSPELVAQKLEERVELISRDSEESCEMLPTTKDEKDTVLAQPDMLEQATSALAKRSTSDESIKTPNTVDLKFKEEKVSELAIESVTKIESTDGSIKALNEDLKNEGPAFSKLNESVTRNEWQSREEPVKDSDMMLSKEKSNEETLVAQPYEAEQSIKSDLSRSTFDGTVEGSNTEDLKNKEPMDFQRIESVTKHKWQSEEEPEKENEVMLIKKMTAEEDAFIVQTDELNIGIEAESIESFPDGSINPQSTENIENEESVVKQLIESVSKHEWKSKEGSDKNSKISLIKEKSHKEETLADPDQLEWRIKSESRGSTSDDSIKASNDVDLKDEEPFDLELIKPVTKLERESRTESEKGNKVLIIKEKSAKEEAFEVQPDGLKLEIQSKSKSRLLTSDGDIEVQNKEDIKEEDPMLLQQIEPVENQVWETTEESNNNFEGRHVKEKSSDNEAFPEEPDRFEMRIKSKSLRLSSDGSIKALNTGDLREEEHAAFKKIESVEKQECETKEGAVKVSDITVTKEKSAEEETMLVQPDETNLRIKSESRGSSFDNSIKVLNTENLKDGEPTVSKLIESVTKHKMEAREEAVKKSDMMLIKEKSDVEEAPVVQSSETDVRIKSETRGSSANGSIKGPKSEDSNDKEQIVTQLIDSVIKQVREEQDKENGARPSKEKSDEERTVAKQPVKFEVHIESVSIESSSDESIKVSNTQNSQYDVHEVYKPPESITKRDLESREEPVKESDIMLTKEKSKEEETFAVQLDETKLRIKSESRGSSSDGNIKTPNSEDSNYKEQIVTQLIDSVIKKAKKEAEKVNEVMPIEEKFYEEGNFQKLQNQNKLRKDFKSKLPSSDERIKPTNTGELIYEEPAISQLIDSVIKEASLQKLHSDDKSEVVLIKEKLPEVDTFAMNTDLLEWIKPQSRESIQSGDSIKEKNTEDRKDVEPLISELIESVTNQRWQTKEEPENEKEMTFIKKKSAEEQPLFVKRGQLELDIESRSKRTSSEGNIRATNSDDLKYNQPHVSKSVIEKEYKIKEKPCKESEHSQIKMKPDEEETLVVQPDKLEHGMEEPKRKSLEGNNEGTSKINNVVVFGTKDFAVEESVSNQPSAHIITERSQEKEAKDNKNVKEPSPTKQQKSKKRKRKEKENVTKLKTFEPVTFEEMNVNVKKENILPEIETTSRKQSSQEPIKEASEKIKNRGPAQEYDKKSTFMDVEQTTHSVYESAQEDKEESTLENIKKEDNTSELEETTPEQDGVRNQLDIDHRKRSMTPEPSMDADESDQRQPSITNSFSGTESPNSIVAERLSVDWSEVKLPVGSETEHCDDGKFKLTLPSLTASAANRQRLEHVNAILVESMSSTEADNYLNAEQQRIQTGALQSLGNESSTVPVKDSLTSAIDKSTSDVNEKRSSELIEKAEEAINSDQTIRSSRNNKKKKKQKLKFEDQHPEHRPWPTPQKAVAVETSLSAPNHQASNETSLSVDVHISETLTISQCSQQPTSGYQSMASSMHRRVGRMPTGIDDTGFRSLMSDLVYDFVDQTFEVEPLSAHHLSH